MNKRILNLIKTILRRIGIIIIKSKDHDLIIRLKQKFVHNERGFVYGLSKRLVDSLYCHASPGTLESIILFLDKNRKENEDNKLLNLGGGTGQVSDIFCEIGYDVYNIDIEQKNINKKNIKFDLNNTEVLPVSKKYFDVVVCSEIIEHIENPWKLFRDAKNSLKDGGILIMTTPNIQSLFSRIKFIFTGYFQWFTPDCFSYHINPVFKWEIDLIIKKYNFQTLDLIGSGDYYMSKKGVKSKKIIRNNENLIIILKNNS